jgi:hypothetical protein
MHKNPAPEFQGLTKAAEDLLAAGRSERRLTDQQLLQLRLHIKMISSWADRVPQKTSFFFVRWQPILVVPRIDGYSGNELGIAVYLQPLHSQLCAIALQVLWKANQLIRTLSSALDSADLIVAATMARSLVETAAAFGCESSDISKLWRARCERPAPDLESLNDFANDAGRVVGQILFGTKLKRDKEPETGIERTNILTLIDKAEKLSENPGLRRLYDLLCDTVHPSIGSSRCFWTEELESEDRPILTFVTERSAKGELSDLPFTIGLSALWALTWLGWMWNLFDRTRKDLCLTAKIYGLPVSYYGIVRPGAPGEYCPCGSTAPLAAALTTSVGRKVLQILKWAGSFIRLLQANLRLCCRLSSQCFIPT